VTWFRPALMVGTVVLLLVLAGDRVHARDVWERSYDASTGTRFIPVELWTGGAWDGTQRIRLTPARLVFGERGEKRIVGPVPWKRPGSGEVVQVYERYNGDKKQLFALTSRRDGLGRIFDSRYGRDCVDEVKFPLGLWKQGETRRFSVVCNGGRLRRTVVLTIVNVDFVWKGRPHALQFHWVVDGGGKPGTDMLYIYSPGRGLVSVVGEE
jgi:hypothetical protein